jgi:hypothetical protein
MTRKNNTIKAAAAVSREDVIAWLGERRGQYLARHWPGALKAGMAMATSQPREKQAAFAALKALQLSGSPATTEDIRLFNGEIESCAVTTKEKADEEPNTQAQE